MKHLLASLFVFLIFVNYSSAVPTEKREWSTASGHKTEAIALRIVDGKVHLKKSNGAVVKVKLSLLTGADQEFLKKHFKIDDSKQKAEDNALEGSGAAAAEGLAQPAGKLSGPISANGSTYYVYVPKTLKAGRKASLLFYTHSGGGGNGHLINQLSDAAETLGWIMAISVESKNGNRDNSKHVANCLKHIFDTLPVDEDRIHYSGNSGGAAMAFVNSSNKKAFGIMPNIGYIPNGVNVKAKVIYGMGGGNDYNRYLTAYAADKFKKNGFHRMSTKGHGEGPFDHYMDGMIWMHCKYLEMKRPSADEKKDFEASIISWLNKLKSSNPKRAYHNACVVRDVYKISGKGGRLVNAIIRELSADRNNVLYHEGLLDIDELSGKKLAALGEGGGSKMKHYSKAAATAAEKLKKKYGSVQEIVGVLNDIIKETVPF